jgi:hypothetical protein
MADSLVALKDCLLFVTEYGDVEQLANVLLVLYSQKECWQKAGYAYKGKEIAERCQRYLRDKRAENTQRLKSTARIDQLIGESGILINEYFRLQAEYMKG